MIKNGFLKLFTKLLCKKSPDFKKIPIIINNYNRLTTLKRLISDLEKRGYLKLFIIDNNSTYPPLLEYYKHDCKYKVFQLKKNMGFKALWKTGLWYRFFRNYYCYTDSDLSLHEKCPEDFMKKFFQLLQKYPEVHKVGFSLKFDDLPDYYKQKKEVISWESKFYVRKKESNIYIAPIDTTFALYRPFSRRGKRDGSQEMLRTGFPYQCYHLPWYNNSNSLSEEEEFYESCVRKSTHWSGKK